MSTEGYKKKDIQRSVQKVHLGSALSSKELDDTETTERVEIGFPAEKVTLVTTGDLEADVTPKLGSANSNSAISATTTIDTTTTTHMFTALEISRTAGSGKVLILAK